MERLSSIQNFPQTKFYSIDFLLNLAFSPRCFLSTLTLTLSLSLSLYLPLLSSNRAQSNVQRTVLARQIEIETEFVSLVLLSIHIQIESEHIKNKAGKLTIGKKKFFVNLFVRFIIFFFVSILSLCRINYLAIHTESTIQLKNIDDAS